jgi:hypothetical protein
MYSAHFPISVPSIFMHGLFFYPEDGGSRFFQNAGNFLPHYKSKHPRRQESSYTNVLYIKNLCQVIRMGYLNLNKMETLTDW